MLEENPSLFSKAEIKQIHEDFKNLLTEEKLDSIIYASVYCRMVYGTSFLEYNLFRFGFIPHRKRLEYLTCYNRSLYTLLLNNRNESRNLSDKYKAYQILKPYYKREIIEISSKDDYETFADFAIRHPHMFVKPANLSRAIGVFSLELNQGSLPVLFDSILKKLEDLKKNTGKENLKMLVEEKLFPSDTAKKLYPYSISKFRVTTILVHDKVHFFYPTFELLLDEEGKFGCLAAIDPNTGTLLTDGFNALCTYEKSPLTGTAIKGFQLPEWKDCLEMLEDSARKFPGVRYIGWDVTHTEKGWCIIEGNSDGGDSFQSPLGHGLKKEFENLTGIHIPFHLHKISNQFVFIIANQFFKIPCPFKKGTITRFLRHLKGE